MSDQPIPEPTPQESSQEHEDLFGRTAAELRDMGMDFLLQPSVPEPETYKPLSTGSRADPNEPLEPLEPLDDAPQPAAPEHDLTIYRDPSRLWGYSPKDLKRMGMGSLIPPKQSSSRTAQKKENPKMEIIDLPSSQNSTGKDNQPPKRRRGRLDDSLAAPSEAKRRRGGQPGNLNGLKHGLYLEGARIRNTTPLERAQLFDIADMINYVKDFMEHTYQSGLLTKDLSEINETMRSLSLAGMSLTRLIAMHDQHISSPLPSNIPVNEHTNILKVVEYYKKKLSPIVDLSDLDLRGLEND